MPGSGDLAYRDPEVANAYGPAVPGAPDNPNDMSERVKQRFGRTDAIYRGRLMGAYESEVAPRPKREIAPDQGG